MLTGGCFEVYLLVQQQVLWGLPTGGIGSLRLWPRLSSVGPSKFGGPRLDFEIFFEFWIVCVVVQKQCGGHLSRLMFAIKVCNEFWYP